MNYYEMLYNVTAMLLLYTVQMKDYPYSTVIERYIYESRCDWERDKYVDVIGILLSLDRNSCEITRGQLDELEQALNSISDRYISDNFSNNDYLAFSSDYSTAQRIINYYKTTEGKLK